MKRDYKLFMKDILECIESIKDFIGDMDFKQFIEDDKTSSAVIRKLEIIGEATKNIPRHIRMMNQQVPWSDMAKMRDKMSHVYFGVDYEIVWEVVKKRLPEIKPHIEKILYELQAEEDK